MVSYPKIELSDIYWHSFIHMETSTKIVNFLICYFEEFGAVYSETYCSCKLSYEKEEPQSSSLEKSL